MNNEQIKEIIKGMTLPYLKVVKDFKELTEEELIIIHYLSTHSFKKEEVVYKNGHPSVSGTAVYSRLLNIFNSFNLELEFKDERIEGTEFMTTCILKVCGKEFVGVGAANVAKRDGTSIFSNDSVKAARTNALKDAAKWLGFPTTSGHFKQGANSQQQANPQYNAPQQQQSYNTQPVQQQQVEQTTHSKSNSCECVVCKVVKGTTFTIQSERVLKVSTDKYGYPVCINDQREILEKEGVKNKEQLEAFLRNFKQQQSTERPVQTQQQVVQFPTPQQQAVNQDPFDKFKFN